MTEPIEAERPIWDNRATAIRDEIRDFLEEINDEGTSLDTGGGDNLADVWVTIDGTEYLVTVKALPKPLARPA